VDETYLLAGAVALVVIILWSSPVAILLIAACGVVGVTGWQRSQRAQRPSGWAHAHELRILRVRRPTKGRLTIGTTTGYRRLLAAEPRASLLVLGPSQSGKTTGLAIPAILEWDGPIVATSVKSDLVRATLDYRATKGPTWVFDPTASTGLATAGWSPLTGCRDWQGARRVAAWLCSAARRGTSGVNDEEFWYAAAGKLLAPYLLAAAATGADMGQVVRWVDAEEQAEIEAILDRTGHEEALMAASASWQREERTLSSVFTTAEMVLDAYGDPAVARAASTTDFEPAQLVHRGSLFVCAPGHEQERLFPVFTTLLQSIITAAYNTALRAGRPLDPPLLIVLDEAANIAPLRDLDALASTAAGHGVQLVTVWQDLAQVRARYGEKAATVVNNHRAKVVLSGISDPATLEYASRLIGDAEIHDHSVTIAAGGARSTTRSRRERKLAPDAELRRIRPGEGVLVYGHLPPARIRLRVSGR
jgi:type IV secretion system protein VirD4